MNMILRMKQRLLSILSPDQNLDWTRDQRDEEAVQVLLGNAEYIGQYVMSTDRKLRALSIIESIIVVQDILDRELMMSRIENENCETEEMISRGELTDDEVAQYEWVRKVTGL